MKEVFTDFPKGGSQSRMSGDFSIGNPSFCRRVSWVMLTSSPPAPEIDVHTVASQKDSLFLCDVRKEEEYARGYVPGAVNIPGANLASRLEEFPKDRTLVVLCERGHRAEKQNSF